MAPSLPVTPLGDGPVPKHAQLREELGRRLRDLGPDDAIPSERELMSTYGVSRATVRRAVEGLVADGVLHRIQGKGTFVARHRVQSHLHLASFTQDMRRRGLVPSTRVARVTLEHPPQQVAAELELAPGGQAWLVERVRLADGEPMAFERAWHPASLFPGLDQHDLTASLYALLADAYGVTVDAAEQTAWADQARSVAHRLDVAPSAPVMVFDRLTRADDRPVERVRSWYRGDRYQLHMSLDLSMAP